MDAPAPFFPSDSQIKLYQTVAFSEKGLGYQGCLWQGEMIDPRLDFFPFDHPWAVFPSEAVCHFAYPQTLPWIGSLFYPVLGLENIGQTTVILFIATLALIGSGLRSVGMNGWVVWIATIALFASSLSHTALHYSEITLGHFLFSIAFFSYMRSRSALGILGIYGSPKNSQIPVDLSLPQNRKLQWIYGLVGGLALGWIPFTRPESVIVIVLLLGGLLLWEGIRKANSDLEIKKNSNPNGGLLHQKEWIWFLGCFLAGLAVLGSYAWINYIQFGHASGLRGLVVGEDFSSTDWAKRGILVRNYLLGIQDQVGVVKTMPLLLLAPFAMVLVRTGLSRIFLGAGFLSFVLILILTPYNADGLYASLRFFEGSYLVVILGFAFGLDDFLKEKNQTRTKLWTLLVLGLAIQISIGIRYYRDSNQLLRSVAQNQAIVYRSLHNSHLPLVHTSLFTAYLTGSYYLEAPVFLAYTTQNLESLVEKFADSGNSSFAILYYTGEIPFNPNHLPQYRAKTFTDVKIPLSRLEKLQSWELAGFHLDIYRIQEYAP